MSHIDGVMQYTLQKPFKYQKSGQNVDACTVDLYEFNAAHTRFYPKLKTYVDRAIMDAQKLNSARDDKPSEFASARGEEKFHEISEEDHEFNANDMAELLEVSFSLSDDDDRLGKFLDAFRDMVCHTKVHPIAKLDGEVIVNDVLWGSIHPEDQLQIAYRYCSFFGIGLLGRLKAGLETAPEQPTEVKEL